MKKSIKRIISLVMAATIVISSMQLVIMAENSGVMPNATSSANDFLYTIIDSQVEITSYVGNDEEVVIPSEIEGYPVTSIGGYAFEDSEAVTKITIPKEVMNIKDTAFNFCFQLTSIEVSSDNPNYSTIDGVLFNKDKSELICCPANKSGDYTIPESVTIIGDGAFKSCSSLTNISISESVKTIGDQTFFGCNSLTSITIPAGVTSIGDRAFAYCNSLTSINVSANNENYSSSEDGVLFNKNKTSLICCPSGKSGSYTVPNSVTSLGQGAFYVCYLLTNIIIPDSVTRIDNYAFYGCSTLESVDMPAEVENIGYYTFGYCSSLTQITVPNRAVEITDYAFPGCVSLQSITIPESVTRINSFAFSDCTALTDVYFNGTETEWNEIIIDFDNGNEALVAATIHFNGMSDEPTDEPIEGETSDFEYEITDTQAEIIGYIGTATEVVIPSVIEGYNVTSIGEFAFFECETITKIIIPQGVKKIGESAFEACRELRSINIPEGVKKIGEFAFYDCDSLTTITIPSSVSYLSESLFDDCDSLNNITVSESNIDYSSEAGVLFNKNKTKLLCFPPAKKGNYIIPESVTTIGTYAFEGYTALTSITIPAGVTMIERGAFCFCTSLESITIQDKVQIIESGAFYGCDSLTEVNYTGTEAEWNAIEITDIDNKPLLNANINFNAEIVIPERITPSEDSDLVVDPNAVIVLGISAETKSADAIAQFENAENIQIVDKDGKLLNDDAFVGTGCKIQLVKNDVVKDEVTVVIKGEIDGNGIINSDDAIYLLRNTLFTSLYPVIVEDDVDGNGIYDSEDAIYLLKHVLFPDLCPLK